jgi:hypothetical protein
MCFYNVYHHERRAKLCRFIVMWLSDIHLILTTQKCQFSQLISRVFAGSKFYFIILDVNNLSVVQGELVMVMANDGRSISQGQCCVCTDLLVQILDCLLE